MDNTQTIQILQPPKCGIVTSNGIIAARNSGAVMSMMEKKYELEHRGSKFRAFMTLATYIAFLCFLYFCYKAGRTKEEEKDKDRKED